MVGQFIGVGHLKFGMAPDDFSTGALAPDNNAPDNQPGMKYYVDNDLDGITWGRLAPDRIELGFYYDHLIDIRLHFTQPFGDLLAVARVVCEKYGTPPWSRWITVDGTNVQGGGWTGGITQPNGVMVNTVEMQLAFPYEVPPGSDEGTLAQKTAGMLELNAPNLYFNLRQDHIKDLEGEVLKAHDLEKIKKDL